MGQWKRPKKKPIGEPFIHTTVRMFDSPAYQQLTNAARTAYMLLQRQVNGRGQNEVVCPYTSAIPYMNKNTFARAIRQLEDLGFIEKTQFGGLYRKTNVYRFIEDWRAVK